MAQLKVTLKKSAAGEKPAIRESVRSLGLKKIGQTVIKEDVPSIRGMIHTARHLVTMEEVD